MREKTYYERNKDMILNRANTIMKTIKKDQEKKQDINTETYLKKKKAKRENMEKTYITKRLKKRNKN